MTEINDLNVFYMKRALKLAALGTGNVSPNPLVGAVIVKENVILSEGYHKVYGGPHAEANAINNLKGPKEASGATLYCNLEPCCHTNKQTPPCAQAIIKAGIKKVVIANLDPNPLVAGNGLKLLKAAGIEVITDICLQEGEELNRVFFKNMKSSLPYIHLKCAQTLDGKMASLTNDSKWISDEDARQQVHLLRRNYDAVAVGRNTQTIDNPKLTARLEEETCPYRIVFGNINKLDLKGSLFTDQYINKTIVLTKHDPVEELKHLTWINISSLSLKDVFELLFTDYKITSILIEGGPTLFTDILNQKLYDRVTVYISPVLLGNGHSIYKNDENKLISEALNLGQAKWSVLNQQAVLEINNVHRSN